MNAEYLAAWLHLHRAPGLGPVRVAQLLAHFGNATSIIGQKHFSKAMKVPAAAAAYLSSCTADDIATELAWLEKPGNKILTLDDPLYPPQLKLVADPPMLLFVKGNVDALVLPQLAVVGSRRPSQSGSNNARTFCADLVQKGLVITSGLASGIDTQAHRGALDGGGQTVAVMGTGINSIYPKQNQALAKAIIEQGAVVSEFSLNTQPHAHNFPRRNRIIAGLSLGTLVVEAAKKSGTLITARMSLESNRPVMAIPGSIHSPMAKGCHLLIRQGAILVESAEDIMFELMPHIGMLADQLRDSLSDDTPPLENTTAAPHIELTETQQLILSQIDHHPIAHDHIIKETGLDSTTISSDLLILELSGFVEKLPGAQYQRT